MLERPRAPELLAAARAALAELLPALPEDRRYAGLMLANALAIAARDAAATDPADIAEARSLCRRIRDGDLDPGRPEHAAVRERLDAVTRARCAVSAPKALARRGDPRE